MKKNSSVYFHTSDDFKYLIIIENLNAIFFSLEFGMKMTQNCQKFLLDEKSDFYFLSGIDGSLFVTGGVEELLNNDQYCMDYFREDENSTIEVMKNE